MANIITLSRPRKNLSIIGVVNPSLELIELQYTFQYSTNTLVITLLQIMLSAAKAIFWYSCLFLSWYTEAYK
jgi:hypothetical protein